MGRLVIEIDCGSADPDIVCDEIAGALEDFRDRERPDGLDWEIEVLPEINANARATRVLLWAMAGMVGILILAALVKGIL